MNSPAHIRSYHHRYDCESDKENEHVLAGQDLGDNSGAEMNVESLPSSPLKAVHSFLDNDLAFTPVASAKKPKRRKSSLGRRVSFAENLTIHEFQRDDEYITPPDDAVADTVASNALGNMTGNALLFDKTNSHCVGASSSLMSRNISGREGDSWKSEEDTVHCGNSKKRKSDANKHLEEDNLQSFDFDDSPFFRDVDSMDIQGVGDGMLQMSPLRMPFVCRVEESDDEENEMNLDHTMTMEVRFTAEGEITQMVPRMDQLLATDGSQAVQEDLATGKPTSPIGHTKFGLPGTPAALPALARHAVIPVDKNLTDLTDTGDMSVTACVPSHLQNTLAKMVEMEEDDMDEAEDTNHCEIQTAMDISMEAVPEFRKGGDNPVSALWPEDLTVGSITADVPRLCTLLEAEPTKTANLFDLMTADENDAKESCEGQNAAAVNEESEATEWINFMSPPPAAILKQSNESEIMFPVKEAPKYPEVCSNQKQTPVSVHGLLQEKSQTDSTAKVGRTNPSPVVRSILKPSVSPSASTSILDSSQFEFSASKAAVGTFRNPNRGQKTSELFGGSSQSIEEQDEVAHAEKAGKDDPPPPQVSDEGASGNETLAKLSRLKESMARLKKVVQSSPVEDQASVKLDSRRAAAVGEGHMEAMACRSSQVLKRARKSLEGCLQLGAANPNVEAVQTAEKVISVVRMRVDLPQSDKDGSCSAGQENLTSEESPVSGLVESARDLIKSPSPVVEKIKISSPVTVQKPFGERGVQILKNILTGTLSKPFISSGMGHAIPSRKSPKQSAQKLAWQRIASSSPPPALTPYSRQATQGDERRSREEGSQKSHDATVDTSQNTKGLIEGRPLFLEDAPISDVVKAAAISVPARQSTDISTVQGEAASLLSVLHFELLRHAEWKAQCMVQANGGGGTEPCLLLTMNRVVKFRLTHAQEDIVRIATTVLELTALKMYPNMGVLTLLEFILPTCCTGKLNHIQDKITELSSLVNNAAMCLEAIQTSKRRYPWLAFAKFEVANGLSLHLVLTFLDVVKEFKVVITFGVTVGNGVELCLRHSNTKVIYNGSQGTLHVQNVEKVLEKESVCSRMLEVLCLTVGDCFQEQ